MLTRRSQLLEDEAKAVCGLTKDQFPEARPAIFMQLLQKLHSLQEDVVFQADMTHCIQAVASQSRYCASSVTSVERCELRCMLSGSLFLHLTQCPGCMQVDT
jgi:hypothetical protein